MANPEGGHGERKDKEYFSQEIDRLLNEAEANGQKEIAIVLSTLLGLMAINETHELSKFCIDLARRVIKKINQIKKTPKN